MRFKVGDIAIHRGGGAFWTNEEVEIIAVGPWAPETVSITQSITNLVSCDYIVRSLKSGLTAFELDGNLKPRPGDAIPKWCRDIFKQPEHA